MITLTLQFFCICAASWTFWAFVRWLTVTSPLDNIAGPPPESFLKGNMAQLMNRNGWEFHKQLAEDYGSVVKISGLCGSKQLYVFDPKALHHIVVKDQYIYEETSSFIATVLLVFGPGLFATLGDQHRKQRKMLNPVFSSKHMRCMLPTFYGVVGKLRDAVACQVANGTAEIDMLHWMTRAALELIGQCGLGYSFDPLTEDVINPFATAVKAVSSTLFGLAIPRQFLPFIVKSSPPKFRRFMMDLLPWKRLHKARDISDILQQISREVLDSKKSALLAGDDAVSNQIGRGKDLMGILLKANMDAPEDERLTDLELLGQVSTFIFTAMDTTSSALARILDVLSQHPKEQEKLRQEIRNARQDGDPSHDELVALPYLDAICRETLRLYPPIPQLLRTTRKDVVLPLSKPIRGVDGKEISEIPIPNNTNVIVAIMASNHSADMWGEDVLEWKPERWLSPLPDSVMAAHLPGVYSNLMTFSGGGRACIGFKFSLLEMKSVLSLLVGSFSFSPTGDEITWNMSGQAWPSVTGSHIPRLPLRVAKAT